MAKFDVELRMIVRAYEADDADDAAVQLVDELEAVYPEIGDIEVTGITEVE